MPARLTERQVAGLTGLSPRSIRRRACELRTEPADSASRNGRKARVFHLGSLNPTLQQAFVDSSNVPPALALAVTLPPGPNISEENRAEAEKRYQIIEPIVRPDSFRLLWAEYRNRRSKVIEGLASKHEISRRALYSWLGAWKKGGLLGLVKQKRQDSGEPRSLNPAALDFLLTAAFPSPGSYGQLSVREIHRAYQEERQWRLLHATKPLKDFEKRKYARYLGEDECLLPTCQLPELSCETLRRWSHRIPEAVKIFARGETAFFNNCEILSFRDLKEVLPLDYVVMDHRRLDVFCLVQKRGGWALARPWLTGAVDMRTRRWLAWAIVETPSSDSIASVLKTVLMRFGVPKALYIDNGKDFTCEYLEGTKITRTLSPRISDLGARTRGVLETLGIRVTHAIVRRARSKIIEPCFIATANFDKILPEYCGPLASKLAI